MRKTIHNRQLMLVAKKNIRRYLLLKQHLLPPRLLRGQTGIRKIFCSLRSIQFDPQSPCGNNVDLVLQSRIADIHPADYHNWLYKQRNGIECFDKELCVVPIEDLKACRKAADNASEQRRLKKFIKENRKQLDELLLKTEKNGEISSSQIENQSKIKGSWGNSTRWSKVALETLWKRGELAISKRENNRKYYTIPEKLYGGKYEWSENNKLDPVYIIRRIQSVGILPKSGAGQGWLGIGQGRKKSSLIDKLIQNGTLTEIQINDVKRSYIMLSSDIKLIKKAATIKILPQMAFLAPLDNLLWDREMINDIFDFKYKWETYTPKPQRKYGHYVLPILYGDRFIGRIEPRQVGKTLEIRGLWKESNFDWTKTTDRIFKSCLIEFKKYLGICEIKWLCKRPVLSRKIA